MADLTSQNVFDFAKRCGRIARTSTPIYQRLLANYVDSHLVERRVAESPFLLREQILPLVHRSFHHSNKYLNLRAPSRVWRNPQLITLVRRECTRTRCFNLFPTGFLAQWAANLTSNFDKPWVPNEKLRKKSVFIPMTTGVGCVTIKPCRSEEWVRDRRLLIELCTDSHLIERRVT